jgi:rod shape-determining protein MreD
MGDTQRRRLEEIVARELIVALALVAIALAQVALPDRPLTLAPNVLLLLVVCRGLVAGSSSGARWAFYGGRGLDIGAGTLLGMHALALLAAVMLSLAALARLSRTSWLLPLIGVPLGMLAYHAVLATLLHLTVGPFRPQAYLTIAFLPELLATLIPALPVFLAMRWWRDRRRGAVQIDVY